jgi:CheY-like chemotaxis protein
MPTSVLVVDDDAAFRALAVRILEGMGLSVVGEAETAKEAAATARKRRPQAALVDVSLPDGNGITLAGELAALPWRPRIILTSSDGEAVTERGARAVGAAAFIAKHDLPDGRLRALLTGRPQSE